MKCPNCKSEKLRVISGGPAAYRDCDTLIRRRRECLDCGHRFNATEIIDDCTAQAEVNAA